MSSAIGLQSLAQSVPDVILTHDAWCRKPTSAHEAPDRSGRPHPEVDAEGGTKTLPKEVARYSQDPFGGACERRILGAGGTSLELEAGAARQALKAAGLTTDDVDLLICTSFLPDHQGIGGATYLARELGLRGAAWNAESGCSSALTAFRTACSLIASGQHRRALVVTSCAHSRAVDAGDSTAWSVGDAATAMVVGEVAHGSGYLGGHSLRSAPSSAATSGPAGPYRLEVDAEGEPRIRLRQDNSVARALCEASEDTLEPCVRQALDKAGVRLADVDHFVVDTPRAWFAALCARILDLDPRQTLSLYPLYGDAGPALLGLNLLHAAHWKRFQPGELVLLYAADGDASSSTAAVMRWGEVALGDLPAGASLEHLENLESETAASYHLRRLDSEVLTPASRPSTIENRLQRMISGYVALAVDEPGIMQLFIEDGGDAGRTPAIRARAGRFVEILETTLAKSLESSSCAIEPEVAAQSLLGIIHWGVCCHRCEASMSREEAIEQITFLALHGLLSEPPRRPGRQSVAAA